VTLLRLLALILLLPCLSQADPVIRGPYIQGVTQDSATFLWFTAKATESHLRLRPLDAQDAWQNFRRSNGHTRHQITAKNLTPDTEYCYEVVDTNRHCTPFRSAPTLESQKEVRLAVLGDSGFANGPQHAVARQIEKWNPNAVLHLGDIVYPDGEFEHYDAAFFDPYAKLLPSIPFYTTIGNHDAVRLGTYLHFFAPPFVQSGSQSARFYSFSYGPVLVFALDSNLSFAADSQQMLWFQSQLQKTAHTKATWRIVFLHHTTYSADKRGGRKNLVQDLVPVLEANNFNLVLSGHDHAYQRLEPPPISRGSARAPIFLVSGGGGATLSPQVRQLEYLKHYAQEYHFLGLRASQSKLEIEVINKDGTTIDNVQMLAKQVSVIQ
jgi:hypothetical protein